MLTIKNIELFDKWIEDVRSQIVETGADKKKTIYIDAYSTDYIGTFLPRLLFSQGMREVNDKIEVIVLVEKFSDEIIKTCDAFGAKVKKVRDTRFLIPALLTTLRWYTHNTDSYLQNISLNGIKVRNYLGDTIVRTTKDLYSFSKLRVKDIKKVLLFVWIILSTHSLLLNQKPDYFLTHETGYWYGPIIKRSEALGGHIIQCTSNGRVTEIGEHYNRKINIFDVEGYYTRNKFELIDTNRIDYIQWADDYFDKRRKGLSEIESKDAYTGKKVITKEEWEDITNHNGLKTAVVMAHCFSDDASTSTSRHIYNDYYSWIVRTLEIIQDIDNVNWVLKGHPARYHYNEGDEIFDIFEKFATKPNIYIWDDEISTNSVYNVADAVVTVAGSCGFEFPAFGIPAICAGFPSYGGYGTTIEPTTEAEYISCLKGISTIGRLDEKTIDISKKVACAYNMIHDPLDEFDQIFSDSYNLSPVEGNDYTLKRLMELSESGVKIHDSKFYQYGKKIALKES